MLPFPAPFPTAAILEATESFSGRSTELRTGPDSPIPFLFEQLGGVTFV